VSQRVNKETM